MISASEIRTKIEFKLKEAGVRRAAIFGSYARGDASENSDLDILVELPPKYSLIDYIRLKHQIEDILGIDVDLVEYDTVKPVIASSIFAHLLPIL